MIAVSFNQGSTLIVNIIIARILMKQGFGEYAMVQRTLLTVATLSQLATGYTASKYIAEYRSQNPERAGRIMGLCSRVSLLMACVGTMLIIGSSSWLAGKMLDAPHLAITLVIGSGYLFFSTINGYQTGALAGLETFNSLAKAGIVSGIGAVLFITGGAYLGGLHGTFWGLSISALSRCLIHNIWLRHESRAQRIIPKWRGSFIREKAVILKFALPAAISSYYTMPMIWLTNSFLVQQPGGYGEMALFSAAYNFRTLVLFLPNVMNVVGLSILNNVKAERNLNHYYQVFRSNVQIIFFVTLAGGLGIGILGQPLLKLFGKEFQAGHTLLWILLASSLFEGLSIALFQFVQSHAKIWFSFFSINVPREAFLVISAYFLVRTHAGLGLAAAYLGTTVLGLILHAGLVAFLHKKERSQSSQDTFTESPSIPQIDYLGIRTK